jgi:translation elongation factor P/translation initiation factor 5A
MSPASNLIQNTAVPIKSYGAMNTAAQRENLQFLAEIIQEKLCTEISSRESISVRCAVNKDQLMILVQHPPNVTLDTQKIFTVTSRVLDSSIANNYQQVQIFIRVASEKLPYCQHLWCPRSHTSHISNATRGTTSVMEVETPGLVTITATTVKKNRFYFLKDQPLGKSPQPTPNQIPIYQTSILVGVGLLIMTGFGGGAYWLTRSCMLGTSCKPLDSAKILDASFPDMARVAKSPQDLALMTQRLEDANNQLASIPQLSPHHQEASEITTKLAGKLQETSQVIKGLKAGEIATEQSRFLATNVEELQNRQQLWRQAIAPLENISPSGEFYNLVQSRILQYRSGLQAINVQLLSQEKWNTKLTAAKNVAQAATERENTAKNLVDLEKVQETWQIVVNALAPIPQTSPVYQEAQQLLRLYQPRLIMARERLTKEELAARAYIKAVETAKLAESSQQQNQWQVATTQWQQAVNALQVIPTTSSYYNQAQAIISPYTTALQQAKSQQQTVVSNLTQTRSDLEKTCRGKVRICTFTVDDKIVNVRITRDYEQVLQSNFTNMNNSNIDSVKNHLETLQKAIEVISDNAKMPILVYDAQGQQIHTHLPQANTNLTSN